MGIFCSSPQCCWSPIWHAMSSTQLQESTCKSANSKSAASKQVYVCFTTCLHKFSAHFMTFLLSPFSWVLRCCNPSHNHTSNVICLAGPFIVWNEPNEAALLKRWFEHMREVCPPPSAMITATNCNVKPCYVDQPTALCHSRLLAREHMDTNTTGTLRMLPAGCFLDSRVYDCCSLQPKLETLSPGQVLEVLTSTQAHHALYDNFCCYSHGVIKPTACSYTECCTAVPCCICKGISLLACKQLFSPSEIRCASPVRGLNRKALDAP